MAPRPCGPASRGFSPPAPGLDIQPSCSPAQSSSGAETGQPVGPEGLGCSQCLHRKPLTPGTLGWGGCLLAEDTCELKPLRCWRGAGGQAGRGRGSCPHAGQGPACVGVLPAPPV